jgi:hypothetical protein
MPKQEIPLFKNDVIAVGPFVENNFYNIRGTDLLQSY